MNIQVGIDSPVTRFSAAGRTAIARPAFGNVSFSPDALAVRFGNDGNVKPPETSSEPLLVRTARRVGQVIPSRDRWLKTSAVLGAGGILGGLFNGPVIKTVTWAKGVAWDAPMSFFLNNLYGMDNSLDIAAAAGTTAALDIAVAVLAYRGVSRLWQSRRVGYEAVRDARSRLSGASRKAVQAGVDEKRVQEIVSEALSKQTGDIAAAVAAALKVNEEVSGTKKKRGKAKGEGEGRIEPVVQPAVVETSEKDQIVSVTPPEETINIVADGQTGGSSN